MPFNKALFESWSVNLSYLNYDQIELLKMRKSFLIELFIKINADSRFIDSISEATDSTGMVKYRFSKVKLLVDTVLNVN